MKNNHGCKRSLLSSCISACTAALLANGAIAQDNMEEEIIVTGIRAAQTTAIGLKRDAVSVVDAISAEDIGKLPDVTITDSLQRIAGVQVRRSAGEAGLLNIRGMGQVLTTFNGESYLGANSITSVQPDLSDIPSQLFSGAEIHKSQMASQQSGGISGVVNLKTYRPFDFDKGLTLSGAIQASSGQDSGETDPSVNGLFNWHSESMGLLVSLSHSQANLANYYSGLAGGGESAGWSGFAGEDWSWDWVSAATQLGNLGDGILSTGGADVNGDGDAADSFWSYQGHAAYNRFSERDRSGVNLAFQADLGGGVEVIAEALYTDMDDFERTMGVSHSDKWQRWGWFSPSASTPTDAIANDRHLNTVQSYTGNGRRFKSYSSVQVQQSESKNYNVELNYDNGGAFSGTARLVHAQAQQQRLNSYADIDIANGNQWGVEFQNYPSGALATNPAGYAGYPVLSVDYRGASPRWSGFDGNANLDINGDPIAGTEARSLGDYIADVNSYALGALTSENNYLRESDLDVLRLDGALRFDDSFLSSLEFGLRASQRRVENYEFDLLSPIGDEGCGVKWKATDVTLNGGGIDGACTWGDDATTDEVFYTAGAPTPIAALAPVQVSDFGGTSGIPSVWTLDPSSMDSVEAYHNALFPGSYRAVNPGRSYEVELDERSFFAQANFATGILSGNFGLRAVSTDLSVIQNQVGAAQPYGAANEDAGDLSSDNHFFELLPSLNLKFDFTDALVGRASVTKTTAALDLNQWGGGLAPNFALDSDPDSETFNRFIVISASADGNPDLSPWTASNFDMSLEYYLGSASVLSVSWFYIDVESFVVRGTRSMALADQDGVVRREVDVNTNLQGEGGVLQGLELAARFALSDITTGFWRSFGADINYTDSPSDSGFEDLNGRDLPFQDNSETIYNIVGWYEQGPLQARIAYNYRSERVVAVAQTWGEGTLWQDSTGFVDASVSYDVTDTLSVFANASNISGEKEAYYLTYKHQKAWQSEYEARYAIGVRATF